MPTHTRKTASIATLVTITALVAMTSACKEAPQVPQAECAIDPTADKMMKAESAGCAIVVDGALLVTRIKGKGKVTPPGGGVRSGETARCGAVRQTLEETGLHVKAGELVAIWHNDFHLFMCELNSPADVAAAKTPRVPAGDATEKLLLDVPVMKQRDGRGKDERWAFPSNVVIKANWDKIIAMANPATPTAN